LIHFYKSCREMSYKDRAEFDPCEHGLEASFRLTNYTKLKG